MHLLTEYELRILAEVGKAYRYVAAIHLPLYRAGASAEADRKSTLEGLVRKGYLVGSARGAARRYRLTEKGRAA